MNVEHPLVNAWLTGASSADGSKLFAGAAANRIYTSADDALRRQIMKVAPRVVTWSDSSVA